MFGAGGRKGNSRMVLWGKKERKQAEGGTKRRVRGGCSALLCPAALLCSAALLQEEKITRGFLFVCFFPPFGVAAAQRKHCNIETFRVARARFCVHSASLRLLLDQIPNEERAGIINSFNLGVVELIGCFSSFPSRQKVQKKNHLFFVAFLSFFHIFLLSTMLTF